MRNFSLMNKYMSQGVVSYFMSRLYFHELKAVKIEPMSEMAGGGGGGGGQQAFCLVANWRRREGGRQ